MGLTNANVRIYREQARGANCMEKSSVHYMNSAHLALGDRQDEGELRLVDRK